LAPAVAYAPKYMPPKHLHPKKNLKKTGRGVDISLQIVSNIQTGNEGFCCCRQPNQTGATTGFETLLFYLLSRTYPRDTQEGFLSPPHGTVRINQADGIDQPPLAEPTSCRYGFTMHCDNFPQVLFAQASGEVSMVGGSNPPCLFIF